jgi:preprotein translocase subunit SecG
MAVWTTLFMLVMLFTAVFMILLILVQRGKGGGLAGAFGGMGGQSAFGTKAGDTFTRITIAVAFFWIVICVVGVRFLGSAMEKRQLGIPGGVSSSAPAKPGEKGAANPAPAGSSAPASKSAGKK